MNKLSANGYKGVYLFSPPPLPPHTSLIEIKHMIIYSRSLLRRSPFADGQCTLGASLAHGIRNSQSARSMHPLLPACFYRGGSRWRGVWWGWAGGGGGSSRCDWLVPLWVTGSWAGARGLTFQGFGSAGAVRTRAGPETRRAAHAPTPAAPAAFCFLLRAVRERKKPSLCTYIHIDILDGAFYLGRLVGCFWRERGENYCFWIWAVFFSQLGETRKVTEEKRASNTFVQRVLVNTERERERKREREKEREREGGGEEITERARAAFRFHSQDNNSAAFSSNQSSFIIIFLSPAVTFSLYFFFLSSSICPGGYETSRCEQSSALTRVIDGRLPSVNVKATRRGRFLTRRTNWKKTNRGFVKNIFFIFSNWSF